ncbi:MAG: hypothetical protein J7K84_04680 [Deltaproteobacteria bacterium]|nr:hypothetical protein [Deltaproteobacteria bacterium]
MHLNLHIFNKKFIFNFTVIILLILPCFSSTAFAHKVMIFAWVDGDTIHTQSKFSGGKKAINSDILVYNNNNKLLMQGKTNQKGEFSFKIPARTDLRIVLNASMGHKAEWKISSDEITNVPVLIQKKSEHSSNESAADSFEHNLPDLQQLSPSLTKEEIKNIIEKALNRKLDPVIKMFADLYTREPEIKDIIGGLGYIFGLAGVGFYFANRKKIKND